MTLDHTVQCYEIFIDVHLLLQITGESSIHGELISMDLKNMNILRAMERALTEEIRCVINTLYGRSFGEE